MVRRSALAVVELLELSSRLTVWLLFMLMAKEKPIHESDGSAA